MEIGLKIGHSAKHSIIIILQWIIIIIQYIGTSCPVISIAIYGGYTHVAHLTYEALLMSFCPGPQLKL